MFEKLFQVKLSSKSYIFLIPEIYQAFLGSFASVVFGIALQEVMHDPNKLQSLRQIDIIATALVTFLGTWLYARYEKKLVKYWYRVSYVAHIMHLIYWATIMIKFEPYLVIFLDIPMTFLWSVIIGKASKRFVKVHLFTKEELYYQDLAFTQINKLMLILGGFLGWLIHPSLKVFLVMQIAVPVIWQAILTYLVHKYPVAYRNSLEVSKKSRNEVTSVIENFDEVVKSDPEKIKRLLQELKELKSE